MVRRGWGLRILALRQQRGAGRTRRLQRQPGIQHIKDVYKLAHRRQHDLYMPLVENRRRLEILGLQLQKRGGSYPDRARGFGLAGLLFGRHPVPEFRLLHLSRLGLFYPAQLYSARRWSGSRLPPTAGTGAWPPTRSVRTPTPSCRCSIHTTPFTIQRPHGIRKPTRSVSPISPLLFPVRCGHSASKRSPTTWARSPRPSTPDLGGPSPSGWTACPIPNPGSSRPLALRSRKSP